MVTHLKFVSISGCKEVQSASNSDGSDIATPTDFDLLFPSKSTVVPSRILNFFIAAGDIFTTQ